MALGEGKGKPGDKTMDSSQVSDTGMDDEWQAFNMVETETVGEDQHELSLISAGDEAEATPLGDADGSRLLEATTSDSGSFVGQSSLPSDYSGGGGWRRLLSKCRVLRETWFVVETTMLFKLAFPLVSNKSTKSLTNFDLSYTRYC